MEFQKVIEKRRTIHKYLPANVPDKYIEEIINNGAFAPSSKNRQPWRFVVLKGSKKDTVAFKMIDWVHKTTKVSDPKLIFSNSVYRTAVSIQQAPVLILVYKKNLIGNEYADLLSLGACMENMFLTAVNLKLGAMWSTDIVFAESAINDVLQIKNYELISSLSVGYTNEKPPSKIKERPIYTVLK